MGHPAPKYEAPHYRPAPVQNLRTKIPSARASNEIQRNPPPLSLATPLHFPPTRCSPPLCVILLIPCCSSNYTNTRYAFAYSWWSAHNAKKYCKKDNDQALGKGGRC